MQHTSRILIHTDISYLLPGTNNWLKCDAKADSIRTCSASSDNNKYWNIDVFWGNVL